jgi:opacity protein-like surface antigen
MKRLLLLVAVVLAFSFAAVAQDTGTAGSQTGTSTTKTKKSAKGGGGQAGAQKEHQLTGCIAKDPSGGFTLTNAKHKKGVEVKSDQDLSSHVGHEVKLMGTWEKPTSGGAGGAGTEGKQMRTFTATKVDQVADTCTAAGAGATKGKAHKGKTESSSTSSPKQ